MSGFSWLVACLVVVAVITVWWMEYDRYKQNKPKDRHPVYRWEVTISYYGEETHTTPIQNHTVEVLACNQDEAVELALDELGWDVPMKDVVNVTAERRSP